MFQTHILILLLSLGLLSARGTKDACDPECIKEDTFVADPYSCENYYYCISPGTPSGPYSCPEDKIFDANAKPNHDTPVEPCKATATCVPQCVRPECQVSCEATFDTVVDTTNCTNFFLCIKNDDGSFMKHPDTCPSDRPFFNGADCSSHKEECCNVCEPSCEGEEYGVMIPDPFECHNYYTCLGEGADPPMDGPTPCLGGGSFNIDDGKCVQEKNCTNLCDSTSPTVPTPIPSGATTEPVSTSAP